ncbi:MAG: hypothetical protein H6718_30050 [Polyangiaceae bacterium]|nr:hypothetical protein [Myxococcales bacterium]MCB9589695.1 hypothetical protein [Polyangiaceae bacterium]
MQPKLDLDTYARLLAKFAADSSARESLLMTHSLTEDDWEEIDEYWQDRLAEDGETEDEMNPLITRFSEVFTETQLQLAGVELELDRYVEILRQVQGGRELHKVLADERVPLNDYLKAHAHWTKRSLESSEIREDLQAKLSEPRSSRRRSQA